MNANFPPAGDLMKRLDLYEGQIAAFGTMLLSIIEALLGLLRLPRARGALAGDQRIQPVKSLAAPPPNRAACAPRWTRT